MANSLGKIAPELSIIASYQKKAEFNPSYLKEISKLLVNEHFSFEFILVFGDKASNAWTHAIEYCRNNPKVLAIKIAHSNGLHALQLAGILRANGRLCVTLNPYINYDPQSLLSLLFVAEKSNCELVYGCRKRNYNRGLLLHRLFYVPLSFIAGLPSYTSPYRIVKREFIKGLKVKTPFYFHLDQLLKSQIENHSYLDFPSRDKDSFADGFLYDLKHLLVSGFLLEITSILLIVLDIYLLMQAHLISATVLAIILLGVTWTLYMLKWRRRLAFRLLDKLP